MESQQYSLVMFLESIKSEASEKVYLFHIKNFMKYYKLKDFDSMMEIGKSELQKWIILLYLVHISILQQNSFVL